jgi:hypothetical protein
MITFLDSCEDPWTHPPKFDISVSSDRFLRLYAFRNELLLFHHQKNSAMIGTRAAPTAAGAAMLAMLLEARLGETAWGIAPVGEVELAGVLELVMAVSFVDQDCPAAKSGDELATCALVIESEVDAESEVAREVVKSVGRIVDNESVNEGGNIEDAGTVGVVVTLATEVSCKADDGGSLVEDAWPADVCKGTFPGEPGTEVADGGWEFVADVSPLSFLLKGGVDSIMAVFEETKTEDGGLEVEVLEVALLLLSEAISAGFRSWLRSGAQCHPAIPFLQWLCDNDLSSCIKDSKADFSHQCTKLTIDTIETDEQNQQSSTFWQTGISSWNVKFMERIQKHPGVCPGAKRGFVGWPPKTAPAVQWFRWRFMRLVRLW